MKPRNLCAGLKHSFVPLQIQYLESPETQKKTASLKLGKIGIIYRRSIHLTPCEALLSKSLQPTAKSHWYTIAPMCTPWSAGAHNPISSDHQPSCSRELHDTNHVPRGLQPPTTNSQKQQPAAPCTLWANAALSIGATMPSNPTLTSSPTL